MENNKNNCIFRFHRATLEESIQTCIKIESKEHLCKIINKDLNHPNKKIDIDDIIIHPYCNDERINWDFTYIVKLKNLGVVGFINQLL